MAENAPPTGAPSTTAETSRGMPYYEKLRQDLRASLKEKKAVDSSLALIEDTIFQHETKYLEETSAGNIVKGFDNYIKGAAASTASGGAGAATRRKLPISDADRIFSRSSTSFNKHDASTPNSATATPHAHTPTSSFATRENSQPTANGANKSSAANRKKKAPDEDDADSKPTKRGKITYGRD